MGDYQYKMKKYSHKLAATNDCEKANLYLRKLQTYKNAQIGGGPKEDKYINDVDKLKENIISSATAYKTQQEKFVKDLNEQSKDIEKKAEEVVSRQYKHTINKVAEDALFAKTYEALRTIKLEFGTVAKLTGDIAKAIEAINNLSEVDGYVAFDIDWLVDIKNNESLTSVVDVIISFMTSYLDQNATMVSLSDRVESLNKYIKEGGVNNIINYMKSLINIRNSRNKLMY